MSEDLGGPVRAGLDGADSVAAEHSVSRWRYRATQQGFKLVQYKNPSPAYDQYGPYGLVDRATNRVVSVGLSAEDVERILFGQPNSDGCRSAGDEHR